MVQPSPIAFPFTPKAFLAFPGLLLAIAMVAFLGAGLNKLILALCIIGWVGCFRYAEGVREFEPRVRASARTLGSKHK